MSDQLPGKKIHPTLALIYRILFEQKGRTVRASVISDVLGIHVNKIAKYLERMGHMGLVGHINRHGDYEYFIILKKGIINHDK